MMPSLSSHFISSSIKAESSRLYLRDFEAIGWQFAARFANGSGGSIFNVLKPQMAKGGSEPRDGKRHSNAGIGNQDQGLGQH